MYLSLLFWFTLVVPGYVLVRRFAPGELRGGLLAGIALSYLVVMALLSPVSILCYLLTAPLWVFSAACVLAVGWGVWEVSRRRWWGEMGGLLVGAASLELVIVLADMALGAWIGSFFGGDALVHLAKIRFLVDRGVVSNVDPFIAQPHFFPIYHTNLLHALYAACCQLSGVDPYGVWFASLAWGKVLIVSAAYYLSWRVFGSVWAGWIAAIFTVASRGTVTFAVYPNQLAPFWLLPVMIGLTVGAAREGFTRRIAIALGAGSLVLGQLHGLYVIFAILLIGPVIGALAVYRLARRRPDGIAAIACGAALVAGLPFVAVTRMMKATPPLPEAAAGNLAATVAADGASGFVSAGESWVVRDPMAIVGTLGGLPGTMIFGAAVLLGLSGARRGSVGVVLAVMACGAAALFVPPICTLLLNKAGEAWILHRLDAVFRIGLCVLAGPALVMKLEPWLKRGVARLAVVPVVLIAGALVSGGTEAWTWREVWIVAGRTYEERTSAPRAVMRIREFLGEHMPPGSTVLTTPVMGMQLVQAYDCHVVASISASNGVPDMQTRYRDLLVMLAEQTPWGVRRELLRTYDVRFFFPYECSIDWTVGHVEAHWLMKPFVLARLKLD